MQGFARRLAHEITHSNISASARDLLELPPVPIWAWTRAVQLKMLLTEEGDINA